MNNKRVLVNILLVAALGAGLFVSPILGQEARAALLAAPTSVFITYVNTPPKVMCVDDTAPITFTYTITGSGEGSNILSATASGGTLSRDNWSLSGATGSGSIMTSYTAKQEGEAQILVTGDNISNTATLARTFDVVKCQLTLSLGAGYSKSSPVGDVSTELYGKGGVQDDGMGVLMGGGTVQYILTVPYTPPNSGLTCDKYVKSATDSTFVALGKASFTWVHIDLKWTPFDITPGVAICTDNKGRKFIYTGIPGKQIDLNSALKIGTLNFGAPSSYVNFDFGKGWGVAWLVKRKGSGK